MGSFFPRAGSGGDIGQQAVFQITVPTAGTLVQAPSYRAGVTIVSVRPIPTNTSTAFVIVGYGMRRTTGGPVYILQPTSPDMNIFVPSGNLAELQIDALVNGEGVLISIPVRGGGQIQQAQGSGAGDGSGPPVPTGEGKGGGGGPPLSE